MHLGELNAIGLSKLISQQIDIITCIECCKNYTVPTTAQCGHTLCRSCWIGRRSCATCGMQSDKKSLKLNLPLQNLTKHIQKLRGTFEQMFKINVDEVLLENQGNNDDANEKIQDWLRSSQNHFSVPPTDSLTLTQDSSFHVERVTSHVQVHSESKKAPAPKEIEYAPQIQQDWDKIEEMPDNENNFHSDKENIVGPMDIETFDFIKDDEYSTEKPRRSIRHKENSKASNFSNVNCNSSSSMETNRKSNKTIKSWNNVKKMKKEFNKLNKQNKNKLNISIEMCKKTEVSVNANNIIETNVSQPYSIDDKTPDVATNNKNECDLQALESTNPDTEIQNKKIESDSLKTAAVINVNNINKTNEKMFLSDISDNREKHSHRENKVPFLKKSCLFSSNKYIKNEVNGNENCSNINTDDIEITIKVGGAIANIYIKKKDNDVLMNVQCDREIQVSSKDLNEKENEVNVNSRETQNENINIQVNNALLTQSTVTKSNENKIVDKSVSTKKNTASADTATAHEITASVEKELLLTMTKFNSQNKQSNHSVQSASQALKEIQDNVSELNDLDIFDSQSVKEAHVEPLKHIEGTGSAILMPTFKSNMSKNRINEKRNREENDDVGEPVTKKIKEANKPTNSDITKDSISVHKVNDMECSELGNYNEIISQVFANIDADMDEMKKNKHNINKAETTQKRFNRKEILNANQKCSENVFSMTEKEVDEFATDGKQDYLPRQTQQSKHTDEQEDNTELTNKKIPPDECDVIVQSTPVQEDNFSDHSVVEETPQKSASFTKLKSKGEPSRSNSKLRTRKTKSLEPTEATTIINEQDSNIITISDTLVDSPKNASMLHKVKYGGTETPSTINKFVDQIKYKSTPVAKKSLDFNVENMADDEQTCCSSFVAAKTTQEKEFMCKAFEQSCSPSTTVVPQRDSEVRFCVAGSCLTSQQLANLKKLCALRKWTFTDKYTKDLTHLVVGVDEENKSQRSVKFMCALAASKWIVSYDWVARCLQTAASQPPPEEPFEALDCTGSPGPRRSRTSRRKLFDGISFYCMPPFSVLEEETLKAMLTAAGGRVEEHPRAAAAAPTLLLAEPEHTQEDRFLYLALERSVVPVNYEWALNCLGSYSLYSIHELLLCPAALLPPVVSHWPPELMARDD